MASYYYKASIMIAAAALICVVNGIGWYESNDAFWARGCDFVNDDISNVRVLAEECSAACGATASCTHFAWSQHRGGTCWLKAREGGINTDYAIISTQPEIVCGVMKPISALLSLGGDAVDVAETFVEATKQVSTLERLGIFIVSVVLQHPADTPDLEKLVQVLDIIAKQSCEVILIIFREIEVLIVDDIILEKLQETIVDDIILEKLLETVSASKESLICVALTVLKKEQNQQTFYYETSSSTGHAMGVTDSNSCREGTTRCEWWEKQERSLLNKNSECETQYACNFYGFNSNSECERHCL